MLEFEKTTSQEIRPVQELFDDKQSNEFLFKCPHCNRIRGINKEASLRDLKGEQYQDNLCDGWMEISPEAVLIHDVEKL
jgi:hypothetical protein